MLLLRHIWENYRASVSLIALTVSVIAVVSGFLLSPLGPQLLRGLIRPVWTRIVFAVLVWGVAAWSSWRLF